MELNYKSYGQGSPLIILHGFMGSLDNWHTLATAFGKQFHVFTLDQRNHGKSPHSDAHSIPLMVQDLLEFINQQQLKEVSIIGHSMGGKVAMQFALEYPSLVKNLVIVDIAPKQYKRGHDDVFKAIFAIPIQTLESRKEAEDLMEPFVSDFGTRQFLLKNLDRKPEGGYQWKMNLPILHKDYDCIIQNIVSEEPFLKPTLFIKGARSGYIKPEDETDIFQLFPSAQIQTIPDAGHWVHAENPKDFFEVVDAFLLRN